MDSFPSSLFCNDRLIAREVMVASSFFQRLRGLLGRAALGKEEALIIPRCRMVHMFFMRFPIDVLFCSESWEVVALCKHLSPWQVSPSISGATQVIEMSAGRIDECGITIGQTLSLR